MGEVNEDTNAMEFVPRATSKIDLPTSTIIRRSNNARANLHDDNSSFRFSNIPGSNFATKSASESIFFKHQCCNRTEESWSLPCNTLCWHCSHGFDGAPVPVPKAYDIHEKKYIVTGTFCSLGCAKAYIFSCHTFDVAQVATIFSRMASEVYGETDVRMNPPFQSLKAFGGTMDINTFRNNAKGVFVHEAPFISNYMVIEERTSAPTSVSDNWKHTIRGLRRPLKPISIDQGESEKALYDDFVASKEGEVKEKDTTNSQGSSTGNLARFIQ